MASSTVSTKHARGTLYPAIALSATLGPVMRMYFTAEGRAKKSGSSYKLAIAKNPLSRSLADENFVIDFKSSVFVPSDAPSLFLEKPVTVEQNGLPVILNGKVVAVEDFPAFTAHADKFRFKSNGKILINDVVAIMFIDPSEQTLQGHKSISHSFTGLNYDCETNFQSIESAYDDLARQFKKAMDELDAFKETFISSGFSEGNDLSIQVYTNEDTHELSISAKGSTIKASAQDVAKCVRAHIRTTLEKEYQRQFLVERQANALKELERANKELDSL
ncbi:hypothetical protein ACI2KR_31095 [Pseudomonas luteola]